MSTFQLNEKCRVKNQYFDDDSILKSQSFEINIDNDNYLIQEDVLPERTIEFLRFFQSSFSSVPELRNGKWWLVPKWTLPVWKVVGYKAGTGSSTAALLMINQMLDKPDILVSPMVVERTFSPCRHGTSDYRAGVQACAGRFVTHRFDRNCAQKDKP